MTTLAIMKARMIRENMNRDDLTSEIGEAITSAIAKYQSRRFWFNEQRSVTFSTVAGQSDYGSAASAYIPHILDLDYLVTTYSGIVYELCHEDPAVIERLIGNSAALRNNPTQFAYYGQTLRFYPIPDAVYTMRLAGLFRVAAPATDAEASNPWMTDGERLIRAAANAELAGGVLRDFEAAQYWEAKEAEALRELNRETGQRQAIDTIEPAGI